jgi:NADH dehydrogenase/NADH:ubiquinone oxidoreductase subunit G
VASQRRFGFEERKPVRKFTEHDEIVYEPGKCIKCGICVRLAAKNDARPGLTFIGRGYDVEIAMPFGESIKVSIGDTGRLMAKSCPTGAIALKTGMTAKKG